MYHLLKLNLARNSLRYIIKTYNIKEIHLPYYICNTLFAAIKAENCRIKFYHIDDDFFPKKEFKSEDYIVYPNYFGICDKNVEILSQKYSYLIVDNSHSFYSEPKGFAAFNSARKFLPVFYGSYLWIQKIGEKPETEMDKNNLPNYDKIKIENDFANYEIKFLDKFTKGKIESFEVKNKRKEKFLEYLKKYNKTNCLKIDIDNCFSPFCYPYLAETEDEADSLANSFIEKGICIYRYWSHIPKDYNEYKFFRKLVPLPLQ